MILKKLDVSDVKKIALLHDDSFPDFFLTTLGKPFLEVFYKSIILHSGGIAVGIFENENLLGFAIGSCKKSGFYSDIFKRNFFELGLYCLPSLIRRPQIGKRIFKSLFSKATSEDFIIENATLLSICVDPKQSKRGLGALILKEFEKEAFQLSNGISLTTDYYNNDSVNGFYLKNNYKLISDFNQGDRRMNLYYKKK